MRLPHGYNARLQRTFSWLRMRWSDYTQMWHLEARTAYGRTDVDPTKCNPDTLKERTDGYVRIGQYTAEGLPPLDKFIPLLQRNWTGGDHLKLTGNEESQTAQLERLANRAEIRNRAERRERDRQRNYEQADILWDVAHGTARSQVPQSFQQGV